MLSIQLLKRRRIRILRPKIKAIIIEDQKVHNSGIFWWIFSTGLKIDKRWVEDHVIMHVINDKKLRYLILLKLQTTSSWELRSSQTKVGFIDMILSAVSLKITVRALWTKKETLNNQMVVTHFWIQNLIVKTPTKIMHFSIKKSSKRISEIRENNLKTLNQFSLATQKDR